MAKKALRRDPDLVNIKDYLLSHFMNIILCGIYQSLASGELSGILDTPLVVEPVTESMCDVEEVKCYWHSRTTFLADVRLLASMHVRDEDGSIILNYEYMIVTLELSFIEDERYCDVVEIRSVYSPPEREDMTELDPWLVPKLNWDDVEKWADMIWFTYYAKALNDPLLRNAASLVEKMGLVMDYRGDVYRTRLYLAGCENNKLFPVKQDTLLVSLGTSSANDENQRAMFKCCIAYEWHYLFYMLQGMPIASPDEIPYKDVPADAEPTPDPIAFMNQQMNHGALALMIPSAFLGDYIRAHWPETNSLPRCHDYTLHTAARLEYIGYVLSDEYHLCKSHIKTRMLHLGYWQAKGIYNWTGRNYARAFSASEETARIRGSHYVIGDRVSAIHLFCSNRDFRDCTINGNYVYADGLIVQASPENLESDDYRGLVPTARVNSHVDRYCLRFSRSYVEGSGYDYNFNPSVLEELPAPQPLVTPDEIAWMHRFPDFHSLLTALIRKRTSIDGLAESSLVSAQRIRALCAAEEKSYSAGLVASLCIGLHLPPQLSRIVMDRAGLRFPADHQANAILCLFYLEDMRVLRESLQVEKLLSPLLCPRTAA